MFNPIFQNYKAKFIYAVVWLLVTGIQITATALATSLPLQYIVVDALIFNTILALIFMMLWFPIRYGANNQKYAIPMHILIVGATMLIWLPLGYFLVSLVCSGNEEYLQYLFVSIPWRGLGGVVFYILLALVYYLFIYTSKLNEKTMNELKLRDMVREGELDLLKSQINPHFLFNSLNSINSLILSSPEQAQSMVVALSDYMRRTTFSARQKMISLRNEVENLKRYLSIEKHRFGDKLIYGFDIDEDALELMLPTMILQPLFENAIKHGVYESIDTVFIDVRVKLRNGIVVIEVSNNFEEDRSSAKKGIGVGLKNIRERIHLMYGDEAELTTKVGDGCFVAVLQMPLAY